MKKRYSMLFFFLLLYQSSLAEIQILSYFKPAEIEPGQRSSYIIEIIGASVQGQIQLPPIPGLRIVGERTSRSFQMVNDKTTSKTSFMFEVYPTEGVKDYSTPEFEIQWQGKDYIVPSCRLKVITQSTPNTNLKKSTLFRLETQLAYKDRCYVGQTIPFQTTLSILQGVRVSQVANHPTSTGEVFSNPLFKKAPQQQVINDQEGVKHLITWESLISPLKSGKGNLRFSIDLIAEIEKKIGNRHDDDLFSSLFENFLQETEELHIETPVYEIEVSPLPEQGRPKIWHGAIGNFEMDVLSTLPNAIFEGDPLTIQFKIKGQGNWDNINSLYFEESEYWKSYPPKKSFYPEDAIGFKGCVVFEYIFIPQQNGELKLPIPQFAFFDPENGSYKILQGKIPEKLFVNKNKNAKHGFQVAPANKAEELFQNKLSLNDWTPKKNNTSFIFLQVILGLPYLILLLVFHFTEKRKNKAFLEKKALKKRVQHLLRRLSQTKKLNQVPEFYKIAAELLDTLHQLSISTEASSNIIEEASEIGLLKRIEYVKFSGHATHSPADFENDTQFFAHWTKKLK